MSLRVVVLAEGPWEISLFALRPRPGDVLPEDMLGPAHVLVRRCIMEDTELPLGAVRFQEPQRTGRERVAGSARVARGSDLLDARTLRKLLIWPTAQDRPDVAVVLIDADGKSDRRSMVLGLTRDLPGQRVVGVAVEEFEAWLVADELAVSSAVGRPFPTMPGPETLRPGEAKKRFQQAVSEAGMDEGQARASIVRLTDLVALSRRCPAFSLFRQDLRKAIGQGG